MPGLSNTLEDRLQQWMFKRRAFLSAPTQLHYSLHSADPGDTGANELASSGGYARAALAPDTDETTHVNYTDLETSGTTRRVSNRLDIVFPTATADWASGADLTHFGVWDASTGGTFLFGGIINNAGEYHVFNGNTARLMGSLALGSTPGQMRLTVD